MALEPPVEAQRAIAAWRDAVLGGEEGWRPVPAENLHVTLAFLGSLPEAAVPALAGVLDAVGARRTELVPAGLASVPPRRPRLLALELDDPSGAAGGLQADVTFGLVAADLFEPEKRPFWPHVTVARARRGLRRGVPGDHDPPPGPFTASRVVLYRSATSPSGARYEALHVASAAAL